MVVRKPGQSAVDFRDIYHPQSSVNLALVILFSDKVSLFPIVSRKEGSLLIEIGKHRLSEVLISSMPSVIDHLN